MRRIAYFLLATLLLFTAGCSSQSAKGPEAEGQSNSGKLKVAASVYPMYEFTKAVAGDKAEVVTLVPVGAEPHDWEPTPKDLKALNQAKLFVYNGAGLEQWVDKTLQSLDNKSLVVVESTRGLEVLKGEHSHADEPSDGAHADEALDPHVWLDPTSAIQQVEAIRDGLIKVDEANKATYEANAAAYIDQLKGLDQEFKQLGSCGRKEFFTSHAAFGYLAKRYGLTQHPITGLSPEAEPKPKDLADVIATAKNEKIKYIFFETLVSDKVAKTVASEVGAQTLVLNPIEGLTADEVKAGKTYLSVMRENLTNLKLALECSK